MNFVSKLNLYVAILGIATACTGQSSNTVNTTAQMETEKNTRETAIFASGCFWGTEFYMQKAPGVVATTVGYTGGHVANPTYQQVSGKKTGHFEAVEVVFDPTETSYEALVKLFFETHDPEQKNGQGPDIGPQYRSAIFYSSEAQKQTAQTLIDLLQAKGYNVATELLPAQKFWPAELYHQDYYDNKGGTPYCHAYKAKF